MQARSFMIIASVILLSVTQMGAQEKARVFDVPPEYGSIMLVSDPNCPIRLSGSRFIKYENGGFERIYSVTNTSKMRIKSFQIIELSWLGGQQTVRNSMPAEGQAFLPKETLNPVAIDKLKFVAFNQNNLRSHIVLNRPKDIWLVLVTKVSLSDGSTYDISTKYVDLERFLERLWQDQDPGSVDIVAKEVKLREFISSSFGRK